MAIKGITGAMMAGPIKTPQLTPFPFEQMLAAKQFEERRGMAAMESNMKFMDELDTMGTIPGMEDVGEYFTKPYEDEVNKIIDSFGGDMSAAAVPLQNLYFDYQRSMTDDMKAHRKASGAYTAQQANLAKGVADNTYDSQTAAAMLNQQTQQYDQSLRNYGMGEGERPTGAAFMRTPMARPDFSKDFNEIIDNIKPNSYESYGIIPIEGKPGKYTYGASKVEYSEADARQAAAMDHIMRRDDYVGYVSEQYELGLSGTPYDPSYGTSLDQMKTSDPFLQTLSTDPDEKAAQLRSVGAKDEAEYDSMAAQRSVELTAQYDKDIKYLMDEQGMTREEADTALAENTWDQSQIEGSLYDIAGMARLGAHRKQTLNSIVNPDAGKKKSSSTGTSDVTVPRTTTTPEYQMPTTALQSDKIKGEMSSVNAQIDVLTKMADPNSAATEDQRVQAVKDLERLGVEQENLQQQLTNSEFAEALEAAGMGKNDWGRDQTKGTDAFEKEQAAFDAVVNNATQELADQYLDRNVLLTDFGDGQGGVNYNNVAGALKWASGMGLTDEEWNARMASTEEIARSSGNYAEVNIDGVNVKIDDVLELGKDLRGQFKRLTEAKDIVRNFNPFENVGESEQARIDSRTEQYLDGSLNIYIPHEQGPDGSPISFQEKHRESIGELEQNIKSLLIDNTTPYANAIIAPQVKATGEILDGQPVFVMDIGYYKPTPTADAIPIPDEVMTAALENPSNKLSSFIQKGEAGRRYVVGIPDNSDQVLALADEYIGFAQDTDQPAAQRQKAAQTGVQIKYNLRYGTTVQNTGIETAPSEIFVEDSQGQVYGYVNRTLSHSLYKDYVDENGQITSNDGTVIFDTATDQMRLEKTEAPNGSISYKLYPYYGGSEKGRDEANRGSGSLVTTAASIEDLIFEAFNGQGELDAIFNGQ